MVQPSTRPRWLLAALFSALLLTVLATAALALISRPPADALPKYGQVPAFSLTDQNGRPFSSSALTGKFTAVGFIYTSCPDICPMLTTNMAALQQELKRAGLLGSDVLLLSVSVDPETDTPEVLARYAADRGADTATWSFLTGTQPQIEQVVTQGFRVAYEKPAHQGHGQSYAVSHSGRVLLVDPTGEVRAYYDGEQLDPAKVIADIKKLK